MIGNAKEAARVGQKVLAGGLKGRAVIRDNHAVLVVQVVALFNELAAKGFPMRGMAGRIARKLSGSPCERHIRRIILSDGQGKSPIQECYRPHKISIRRTAP
jgi:hypothetical protein